MKKSLICLLLLTASIASAAEVGHRIPRYWDERAYTDNLTLHGKGVVARDSITLNGVTITDWPAAGSGATSYDNLTNRPTLGGAPLSGAMLDDPANYPVLNQNTTGSAGSVPWSGITGKPTIPENTGTTTSILKGNGSGGFDNAVAGTDYAHPDALDAKQDITAILSAIAYGTSSTGLPWNDNGAVTWKGLADFFALAGVTYTPADNTWRFQAEVIAPQLSTSCNPTDNECFVNAYNAGRPAADNVGICAFSGADDAWGCYTTSGFVAYGEGGEGSMVYPGAGIPNSTGSAWGSSLALDTDLSSASGSDDSVPSAKATKAALDDKIPDSTVWTRSFSIYNYSASYDNVVAMMFHTAATVTRLDCHTGGADTVVVTAYECNASAASCSTTGLSVTAASTNASDTSASNGSIDATDRVVFSLGTISGTPTYLQCDLGYTVP
jgi:hypothetical protein